MGNLPGYHKLIVYQKAKQVTIDIYKATNNYPSHEIHGLTSQIRRSAVSIPANLVEGYSKTTTKDFIRFLDISLGSLAELEFHLELSSDLGYLTKDIYNKLQQDLLEVHKLLRGFQKSLREKVRS